LGYGSSATLVIYPLSPQGLKSRILQNFFVVSSTIFGIKRSDNFGDELGVYTIENCPLKARNLEDDFPLEDFHFGGPP
jgi:hypothetical protein